MFRAKLDHITVIRIASAPYLRVPAREREIIPTDRDMLQVALELRQGERLGTGMGVHKATAVNCKRNGYAVQSLDEGEPIARRSTCGISGCAAVEVSIGVSSRQKSDTLPRHSGDAPRPCRRTTMPELDRRISAMRARLRQAVRSARSAAAGVRSESMCRLAAASRAWLGVFARRVAGHGRLRGPVEGEQELVRPAELLASLAQRAAGLSGSGAPRATLSGLWRRRLAADTTNYNELRRVAWATTQGSTLPERWRDPERLRRAFSVWATTPCSAGGGAESLPFSRRGRAECSTDTGPSCRQRRW